MADNNSQSQNLNLISIFHYVVAALIYLKGAIGFVMMGVGTIAVFGILHDQPSDMEVALFVVGLIFFAAPLALITVTWAIATAVLVAGRRIAKRTHLTYCQVVAGLECLCVPFGTVLGVISLVLLTRDDVKKQFTR